MAGAARPLGHYPDAARGVGILPQQVGPLDAGGFLPNRQLALWPYSRIQDSRLQLGDDFILVESEPAAEPFKIACLNRQGWLAYLCRCASGTAGKGSCYQIFKT